MKDDRKKTWVGQGEEIERARDWTYSGKVELGCDGVWLVAIVGLV